MSGPIRVSVGVVGNAPIKVGVKVPHKTQKIEVKAPVIQGANVPPYSGPYTVEPSESEQTLETNGYRMEDNVTVEAIPSDYVGSDVPRKSSSDLTANGATVTAPAGYYESNASKSVSDASWLAGKTIETDPTVSVDENGLITASYNYSTTMKPVTTSGWADKNHAVSVIVKGTGTHQLTVRDSSDLIKAGATVTAPAGYYAEAASKSVDVGSVSVEDVTATANPTITISTVGRISASYHKTITVTPSVTEGYVTGGESGSVTISGSKTYQLSTQSAKTVTPTESEQTAVESWKYTVGEVKVGAIPSNYVGSGVTRNDSTDLSVSGATVTAPAGYYENAASASVPNATWKNASTVGVVPEISVDSSGLIAANCAGWTSIHPLTASGYADSDTAANIQLSGVKTSQLSTQAAATITPAESEQTAVAAQKFTTGEVKVAAIPADYVGSAIPQRSSSEMTASGATVTAPAGYYAAAATKSVDIGSATVNDTGITANPSISVGNDGKVTATVSKVQSVAPQVTPGYVSAGTAGDITVTGYTEQQLTTQAAQTITPTTTNQTIASGKYLTGAQTILGDANLVPESIVENVTIFGVTGNAPPPVTVVHLI